MKSKCIFWIVCLATFLVSCDNEVIPELNPVQFQVSQPNDDAVYAYGDTVFIESLITWENELHGYEVFIQQVDNDSVVFSSHAHNDSHQMNIYKIWVNRVKEDCDMKLIIKAYTSHEQTWETKTLFFHCLPMK